MTRNDFAIRISKSNIYQKELEAKTVNAHTRQSNSNKYNTRAPPGVD